MRRTGMRRTGILCIFFLFILQCGCMSYSPDNIDRIASPSNNAVLLKGTWQIVKCLGDEKNEKEAFGEGNALIGEKMGFTKGILALGGKSWSEVTYKVKRVNSKEYFLRNGEALKEIGADKTEALVITAYCRDKFLYEFVRISAKRLLILIEDQFYCMDKTSEQFSGTGETELAQVKSSGSPARDIKGGDLQSGLLLAIRTPVKTKDGIGDYSYRTYWISAENRQFGRATVAEGIFLPRMNGFWKLSVDKIPGREGIENIISASRIPRLSEKPSSFSAAATSPALSENISMRIETKLRRAVMYIGNDYVCVENTSIINKKNTGAPLLEKTLRTYPVDNLSSMIGIKISDMAGDNGTMAMENAISDLVKDIDKSSIKSLGENMDDESQQQSFAIYRKTGHWFLKGRLNFKPECQPPYTDFNLNLIPPANMVAYDILQVPWTEIKDSVPQAVDAYTSPNKDIAIILTHTDILLYTISDNKLSKLQQRKIPIAEGSSVIMAEWAIGDYVPSWERSFQKNNKILPANSGTN